MADRLIGGRYRLVEPLGRGATSAVWLAEDEELGRRVALKTLAPAADPARFEREARAAAAMSHPNICSLYDYGESGDRPYMVLEYLPGGSLEERLAAGAPLPDAETLRIAAEIAAGLAHAHERGLVHRDLKPANILFDGGGRAKIADFGIAQLGGGALTEAGTVLGTASYISPEQAAGRAAGPASDVYSFGVVLFRMLAGSLPFVSTSAIELVRMHRDDPPPSLGERRPDVPPGLGSIATRALAKDPAERPADGSALLAELRRETGAGTAGAASAAETRVLRPAPAARPARTRLPLLPLAGATLLLLGAGVALALVGGRGGRDAPAATQTGLSLPRAPSAAAEPGRAPAATAATTAAEATSAATSAAEATTAGTTTTTRAATAGETTTETATATATAETITVPVP